MSVAAAMGNIGNKESQDDKQPLRTTRGTAWPTRKQILYYRHLCRQFGLPYDLAHQQIAIQFNTIEKMSKRIEELENAVRYNRSMSEVIKSEDSAKSVFNMLNLKIFKLRALLEERQKAFSEEKQVDEATLPGIAVLQVQASGGQKPVFFKKMFSRKGKK